MLYIVWRQTVCETALTTQIQADYIIKVSDDAVIMKISK